MIADAELWNPPARRHAGDLMAEDCRNGNIVRADKRS